jgi:uncharacterized lipoprotein YmbA
VSVAAPALRLGCALLAVLTTAACSAVLPKSDPSEFYLLTTLEPAPAAAAPSAGAPSVLVAAVVLPRYLDRRELVTRLASNQLRVEDLELWAEPLRDSVPTTIEHDLATLLGEERVARLPWTAPTPADLVLSIDLRRFEKTSRRTVELEATWKIADGRGGAVRVRRATRLSLAIGAEGTQAAVRSMSDALATLSREIATSLAPLAAR